MTSAQSMEITRLLRAWSDGDESALDRLMPMVHAELRRVARGYMRRERLNHTLQTTALVNETYLRLVGVSDLRWQDRAHFFAVATTMMRRILVNAAKARLAAKRGSGGAHMSIDEALDASAERPRELIALDEALDELSRIDPRKARVVELRCFGGLSVDETAEVLDVSVQTVLRDTKMAKVWLARELNSEPEERR